MAPTVRLTMAQALIRFLSVQFSERDGRRQPGRCPAGATSLGGRETPPALVRVVTSLRT